MAAMLQTSVLAPHLAPRITSGDRYCLVWMSLVKWWFTQHALPRSAILTLMMSKPWLSSALRLSLDDEDPDDALSSEIPDTSRVRMSLETRSAPTSPCGARDDLRGLLPLLLLVVVPIPLRRRLLGLGV